MTEGAARQGNASSWLCRVRFGKPMPLSYQQDAYLAKSAYNSASIQECCITGVPMHGVFMHVSGKTEQAMAAGKTLHA